MIENLTQDGGDRYAAAAPVIAAIAAALGEGAPEDEIREAFGMGPWRVVTPEHRARYGEYFAGRTYWAMIDAMRRGMNGGGVLNIKGFARFSSSPMRGELFPVSAWGPCIAADMQRVEVTIAPGGDDCDGAPPSGVLVGDWSEWADEYFGAINHHFGDWHAVTNVPAWVHALTPEGLELAAARGRIRLMLDYGGLVVVEKMVVSSLLVWGRRVPGRLASNGAVVSWDFEVVNGAPPIDGVFNAHTVPAYGYGQHQIVNWLGEEIARTAVCSAAHLAQWIGANAAGALSSSDVHALAWGDKTIPAAGWAGCFPRTKWVVRGEYLDGQGQPVARWVPVGWITRQQWLDSFGDDLEAWTAAGAVVPAELTGEREGGQRIYASWSPQFIEDLNAPEPGA